MKHRNKTKAIHDYCLDCAGETYKEVTLCQITDCPLWEYRTGAHISSPRYAKRMKDAIERYPDDVQEIANLCELPAEAVFLPTATMAHGSFRGRKRSPAGGAGAVN